MTSRRARLLLGVLLFAGFARTRALAAPPTITGPIAGPPFIPSTSFDLTAEGYVEEEFFVEGTATAYTSAGVLGSDGRWPATPAATAPYKTRIVVRRPANPRRFNGTVVVEWLNVSGGLDAAPDWIFAHTMLMRDGYTWVGVSAQFVGIEGGTNPLGLNLSLKALNPVTLRFALPPRRQLLLRHVLAGCRRAHELDRRATARPAHRAAYARRR